MADLDVILVDDDAAVLSSLAFSLEVEGFHVRSFANGEAVLAQEMLAPTSCLVLDYHMPKMDGLELLGRLRRRGVRAPALLITTPTAAVIARAAQAGVPIVEKPLLGDSLAHTIRELVATGHA